jgi:hypothetical protein
MFNKAFIPPNLMPCLVSVECGMLLLLPGVFDVFQYSNGGEITALADVHSATGEGVL